MIDRLRCWLGLHAWGSTYKDGPRRERACRRCHRVESTAYDFMGGDMVSPGLTYWVEGKRWSN